MASAEANKITVYFENRVGEVNKCILGSSFMGLDPIKHVWPPYYYKRADYGTGIWNPKKKEPVKEVIGLAKDAGFSVIRFYTGNHFNWKNAIGKNRKDFLFGIDEFMKTLDQIGAKPVFIVSYHTGDEQDAADLIEYLNAANDGDHLWAFKRAENGHPEPYGIQYFEFGNEVFVINRKTKKRVAPEEYAAKYLAYQKEMKRVDPSVRLGLNLHHYDWRWDYKVLEVVGDSVDFVIRHIYPPKDLGYYTSLDDFRGEELFTIILGSLDFYTEQQFMNTRKIIRELTGKDGVPHAITEYNIGIDHPQYKFSLGAALVNAELIRIFMKPENKVLIANLWNFTEEAWGMIKLETDYTKHDNQNAVKYIRHPNYYVFELYNKHFGDELVYADVKVDTYDMSQYKRYMRAYINKKSDRTLLQYEWLDNKWITKVKRTLMRTLFKPAVGEEVLGENVLSEKWKIIKLSGIVAEDNGRELMIEFIDPEEFNYYHATKHALIEPNTYYKLSGYIKTENLIDPNGVSLTVGDGRGWTRTHSEEGTSKISGTNDWRYVEVVYKTLPDATSVNVRARRIGEKGPLKGRAYFLDVKLQKYNPPDTLIPYLSVNASRNKHGDTLYLIVINKNMRDSITTLIDIKDFVSSNISLSTQKNIHNIPSRVNAWVLNSPSVYTTNMENPGNVGITHRPTDMNTIPFEFVFEPHSITAIEIGRN